MELSNNKVILLYNAITVIALTFAFALFFNNVSALSVHWNVIVLSSSMMCVILVLVDYNKKRLLTYVLLFAAIALGWAVVKLRKIEVWQYVKTIAGWFIKYQQAKVSYHITYALIVSFVFIGLVTVLCYLIHKSTILRAVSIVILIISLFYCAIEKIEVNKISLAILLIYMLQNLLELCNKIYNRKVSKHNLSTIYMLPICIIIAVVAVRLPSKPEPIRWTAVKHFFYTVSTTVEDIPLYFSNLDGYNFGQFGVRFAGYSDKTGKVLGGAIKDSNRVVLKVLTPSKANSSTYLIGNISDQYRNNSWQKSDIDYGTTYEPMMDFYEMLYGLYQGQLVPNKTEVLFHNMDLNIIYNRIRTKTIFYPSKTVELKPIWDNFIYNSNTPSLNSAKTLKRDFSYKLQYYEINYASQTLQNFLKRISKVDSYPTEQLFKQSFDQAQCNLYLKEVLTFNNEDKVILNSDFNTFLDKRYQVIYPYYTQLPPELPSRVYDLAQQITKGYDNNYDKLKAIEAYFSDFTYTTSPVKTEDGKEFVDTFLFDQKEGYCTYFATAMAVLARCVDIPTRYVEGVLLDYSSQDQGYYVMSSDSSHAWVEAYIKGFGWVAFEPTTKMYGNRYSQWEQKQVVSDETYAEAIAEPELEEPEEQIQMPEELESNITIENNPHSKYMIRLCITIIAIILSMLFAVMLVIYYNRYRQYKTASTQLKAKYLVRDILDYLDTEGKKIVLGETLTDYVVRLGKTYDFDEISLKEVFDIYTMLRYGDKEIEQAELRKIVLYREQLKKHMIKKLGRASIFKYSFIALIRN